MNVINTLYALQVKRHKYTAVVSRFLPRYFCVSFDFHIDQRNIIQILIYIFKNPWFYFLLFLFLLLLPYFHLVFCLTFSHATKLTMSSLNKIVQHSIVSSFLNVTANYLINLKKSDWRDIHLLVETSGSVSCFFHFYFTFLPFLTFVKDSLFTPTEPKRETNVGNNK